MPITIYGIKNCDTMKKSSVSPRSISTAMSATTEMVKPMLAIAEQARD